MKSGNLRRATCLMVASCLLAPPQAGAAPQAQATLGELNRQLRLGDVVFIHVTPRPFKEISRVTRSWVNHVGIVTRVDGGEARIAESTFPFSRMTSLSAFAARSEGGRLAVARLPRPLSNTETHALAAATRTRLGIRYDTGFDLHSRGQYCSRFVHEILRDATGEAVGEVETFQALLARNPEAGLGFWRLWFLGRIPWQRQTVTPASLYRSTRLLPVFDGKVLP